MGIIFLLWQRGGRTGYGWISRIFLIIVVALVIALFPHRTWGQKESVPQTKAWGREIPLSAKRGRILDRRGFPLVDNVRTYNVVAMPVQVSRPGVTAHTLASILRAPVGRIKEQLTQRRPLVYLFPWGRHIRPEQEKKLRSVHLPGIVLLDDTRRIYPYKHLAAHILGFIGKNHQGLAGLEHTYEHHLRGRDGSVQFAPPFRYGVSPDRGSDRFYPPRDGDDLITTLDLVIQQTVEKVLDRAMVQYRPVSAWVLVMNPRDGAVLAMGNRPTFDPEQYHQEKGEVLFRNLPIWKTYEPGSTFKIVTLAAALEEGRVNLKEGFFDPGFTRVGKTHLHCWKEGGHGWQTFLEVMENSCNPGSIALGERLGKNVLSTYIQRLGFGKKTGIDLPGEANGITFPADRMEDVRFATTSYGQGISVTSLQHAAAIASMTNGGWKVTPRLLQGWRNPRRDVYQTSSVPYKHPIRVVSASTSQQIRYVLESVVARGTGRRAFLEGFRVGGKTGTAQQVGKEGRYLKNKNSIVSFIGIAPSDDPQLLVYVAVDRPRGVESRGGTIAAPLCRDILAESLRYLHVPPRKQQIPPVKG